MKNSFELNSNGTPLCLIIMDGYGLGDAGSSNAIYLADTPVMDNLFATASHTRLKASGSNVGLPDGQMGNSEVGHLNIGAGRIVFQELTKLNNACIDGTFASNDVLVKACQNVKDKSGALHLMGLVSDGGVHSSIEHLFALIDMAVSLEVEQVYIHCFLDGRDCLPNSGLGFLQQVENKIASVEGSRAKVEIASVMGRYFAMDRDNRWDRVKKAYDCLVGSGPVNTQTCALDYLRRCYDSDVFDEFVEPISFVERQMQDCDSLVFFNFRPDRARQLTKSFVCKDFDKFENVGVKPHFVCLTEYDPTLDAEIAFKKEFPKDVLADPHMAHFLAVSDASLASA